MNDTHLVYVYEKGAMYSEQPVGVYPTLEAAESAYPLAKDEEFKRGWDWGNEDLGRFHTYYAGLADGDAAIIVEVPFVEAAVVSPS